MTKKRRIRSKRGHPIAVLIGLHDENAIVWRIFSEVIKHQSTVNRGRKRRNQDEKQLYRFHEELVNELRPIFEEGIRSVILLCPPKRRYSDEFLEHIRKHHAWLFKKSERTVVFSKIEGNQAKTQKDVYYLKSREDFKSLVDDTSNREGGLILEELKKILNKNDQESKVLYTVGEIDREFKLIKRDSNLPKPKYIVLTEDYLEHPNNRNKTHRILQIAQNIGVKTKIIKTESQEGIFLKKLGGLVCY
ncbi:MAG: hypothetical protein JW891_00905 [Candidatus Lokiarchaeota archaeon]|nr:hypothetical protein [Candidatus Lokiarchaeota archaeon]